MHILVLCRMRITTWLLAAASIFCILFVQANLANAYVYSADGATYFDDPVAACNSYYGTVYDHTEAYVNGGGTFYRLIGSGPAGSNISCGLRYGGASDVTLTGGSSYGPSAPPPVLLPAGTSSFFEAPYNGASVAGSVPSSWCDGTQVWNAGTTIAMANGVVGFDGVATSTACSTATAGVAKSASPSTNPTGGATTTTTNTVTNPDGSKTLTTTVTDASGHTSVSTTTTSADGSHSTSTTPTNGAGPGGNGTTKIDESGTPNSAAINMPIGAATTAVTQSMNDARDGITGAISSSGKNTGWTWSFALPVGCVPINAFLGVVVNPCTWQSTIHDLLAMIWIGSTIFACAAMVGKTMRAA